MKILTASVLGLIVPLALFSVSAHADTSQMRTRKGARYLFTKGSGSCPATVTVNVLPPYNYYFNGSALPVEAFSSGSIFDSGSSNQFKENGVAFVATGEIMSQPCSRVGRNCESLVTREIDNVSWTKNSAKMYWKQSIRVSPFNPIPFIGDHSSETNVAFECYYHLSR